MDGRNIDSSYVAEVPQGSVLHLPVNPIFRMLVHIHRPPFQQRAHHRHLDFKYSTIRKKKSRRVPPNALLHPVSRPQPPPLPAQTHQPQPKPTTLIPAPPPPRRDTKPNLPPHLRLPAPLLRATRLHHPTLPLQTPLQESQTATSPILYPQLPRPRLPTPICRNRTPPLPPQHHTARQHRNAGRTLQPPLSPTNQIYPALATRYAAGVVEYRPAVYAE